jgi:hypothetical protein
MPDDLSTSALVRTSLSSAAIFRVVVRIVPGINLVLWKIARLGDKREAKLHIKSIADRVQVSSNRHIEGDIPPPGPKNTSAARNDQAEWLEDVAKNPFLLAPLISPTDFVIDPDIHAFNLDNVHQNGSPKPICTHLGVSAKKKSGISPIGERYVG